MNYVIIGNSAAAVGCIEGIRKNDAESSITVISDEKYHTYSRPLISYLLYGKTDEEKMKYRPDGFYKDNNVTAVLGKKVVKIDVKNRNVVLSDGKTVSYDKLLCAAGSRPFIPPMEGLDTVENKFTFMTLDDAKALDGALNENSRALIVGAGLIGLKCAEGIMHKVKSLTVIDLADRILSSILDEKGADIVQKHIENHGVKFILGTSAEKFDGNTAKLSNGETVEFDVLVTAVGVRPNTELLKDAGGNVNKGIVTDAFCRTSLPGIYAAGDCTESRDITTGTDRILALLPNAYMQGNTAGLHMTGTNKPYDKAIPMNAIGFFGCHMMTAGSYDGVKTVFEDGENYKLLITKDGLLKGFIMIGDISRAGIYTKLIREQIPLESIDFELVSKTPQLMAFSQADRKELLGGVR